MTRKQRRGIFIAGGMGILAFATFLVLYALTGAGVIVFSYSPSEVIEKNITPGQRIRLAGLVGEKSVKRGNNTQVEFTITDGNKTILVSYTGLLPDLFREKQGVVAEGKLTAQNLFVADTVLAKHDEKYMPREVVEALKKQGLWKGDGTGAAPGAAAKPVTQ